MLYVCICLNHALSLSLYIVISASMSSRPVSAAERHHVYSRKQKSLGLLCSNFLSLYNREGVDTIGLDDAAFRLGVTKRRIYDVVNILENVGILKRKRKNQYDWKGFGAVPQALEKLKEEGIRENIIASQGSADVKVTDGDVDKEEDDDDASTNPTIGNQNLISSSLSKSSSSSKENRIERSLGQLTQNFIKLFACSDAHMISLDDTAKLLLGDFENSTTKVRRLYDIANVLSSMNLIEKTHTAIDRKPAFRWLGYKSNSNSQSASSLVDNVNEPKNRRFGADITNTSVKRCKIGGSNDKNSSQQVQKQTNIPTLASVILTSSCSDHASTESSKKYEFGPFAPIRVPLLSNSGSDKERRNCDWDNLASIHWPQYHNQAFRDLFGN